MPASSSTSSPATARARSLVIGVMGPTASGKSAVAIALAERLNGEVVSIDSVQQWRGFDVGSGKVTPAERGEVPHHLIDILDPPERGDLASFVRRAWREVDGVFSRARMPILCGGTSMYTTALVAGLSGAGGALSDLRDAAVGRSSEDLWRELCENDPLAAERLHPNDRVRIVRALERARGEPGTLEPGLGSRYTVLLLVLCHGRDELYRRIRARADSMVEHGVVEETQALAARWGSEIPGLTAVGYAECSAYLRGELPRAALADSIGRATTRLAKRQMTYWRNEPRKRGWEISPTSEDAPQTGWLLRAGDRIQSCGAEAGGQPGRPGELRRGFIAWRTGVDVLAERIGGAEPRGPGVLTCYVTIE